MVGEPNNTKFREISIKWSPSGQVLGGKRARKPLTIKAYLPTAIADRDYLISTALASMMQQAERDCLELRADAGQIGLDTVARQLLRAESVASSRIEGYKISNRRLARAAVSDQHDVNAQTVLGNVAAMTEAMRLAGEGINFRRETFEAIHELLFRGTRDAAIAGLVREDQNWIGGDATTPANAEFIPPPPGAVPELLTDLANFCNRSDLPALLQAAIAHAQFETIHPFMDGNGRVGRSLIPMILRRRGVIGETIPPVSLMLANRADRYVRGLTNYRYASADDWFEFFTIAVAEAAAAASGLAESVRDLQYHWNELAGTPRAGSAARKLIEALPTHPVLTLAAAMKITSASDEACRLALNRLEQSGVLKETTAGKRNRIWESVGLFAALDEFERVNSIPGRGPAETKRGT